VTAIQNTTTTEPTFWAAPDLAKAGYPVFPVGLDKTPTVRGGFYAATTDLSQIAAWITEGREDHDIAVPTGRITHTVVIDADTAEACVEMEKRYGAPHVRTRRGAHWYFRHPQDGKVTTRKIAPGLDCKADEGYVVVPPSHNRTWTRGIPDLGALPSLPKDLKRRLREERTGEQGRCGGAGPVGGNIADGNRNGTLTSLAGTMRRRGMGEAEIFAALEVTNRLRCKPPLPVEDVRRISESVARYEPASGQPWWVGVVRKNA
jgi:putative DNA primase/helicase